MQILIRWYVTALALLAVHLVLVVFGVPAKVWEADVTRLTFIIWGVFLFFFFRLGYHSLLIYKLVKERWTGGRAAARFYLDQQASAWFVSDIVLSLGLLGTILGIVFVMERAFSQLTDPSAAGVVLKNMGIGIGMALYTTLAGLVASIILKVLLFGLTRHLEHLSGSTSNETKREVD